MAYQYDFTKHVEFRKGEDYEAHITRHKAVSGEHKCPRCFMLQADFTFGEGNWSFHTTRNGELGMIQPAKECGLFKEGSRCSVMRCANIATKRVGLVLKSGRYMAFDWTCEEHAIPALERMA